MLYEVITEIDGDIEAVGVFEWRRNQRVGIVLVGDTDARVV